MTACFPARWRARPHKLLTVVTKSNAQRHAMAMWGEIAAEVAGEFPDVHNVDWMEKVSAEQYGK